MLRIRGASSSEGCLLSDLSSFEEDCVNDGEETASVETDNSMLFTFDSQILLNSESNSVPRDDEVHLTDFCPDRFPLHINDMEQANFHPTNSSGGNLYADSSYKLGQQSVSYSVRDDRISSINFSTSLSMSFNPEESSWRLGSKSVSVKAEELYTLDAAIDKIGFGKFQIKLMLIVGLAWMADSMEMMLISVLSPTLKCLWYLSTFQEAFITTAVFLGMMGGSSFFGWLADNYGRKKAMYFSTVWILFYGLLSTQAPHFIWMIVLRFLVGVGIGGCPQCVTIVTEFLPTKFRGICVIILEVFWAIGSCFGVLLAVAVMNILGWRWFLGLSTFPLFVFLGVGLWMPESPRFLLTSGRFNDVVHVLHRIAKENNAQVPQGQLVVSDIKGPRGRLSDLFSKDWRALTGLLWVIWFTSAFVYYGIVLMTTEIFQSGVNSCHPTGLHSTSLKCECKLLKTSDYVDFLWTTLGEFPGIICTIFVIERLGRKKTMGFEFTAAALFFILMFICTSRTITVVLMFGVRAFITGVFQAVYVYTPEVFPTAVRGVGLGTCSAVARIGAMMTPFVAQVLLNWSFYYALGVYIFLLLTCTICSAILPVETKGRPLEDTTESGSVAGNKLGYNRIK